MTMITNETELFAFYPRLVERLENAEIQDKIANGYIVIIRRTYHKGQWLYMLRLVL